MAWFRIGGGGISAALKNAMNAVLNKKLGTSQEYAPNSWPENVNLMGVLEEKTAASDSICSFEDGADGVPLKNWLVTLPASLSGYSEVNGVRSGKNLADLSSFVDGYVNSNGTFNTNHSNGEMRSGFIPVKPDTVYYFSIVETTGTAADWVGIGEYTSNDGTGFISRKSFWRFTTSSTAKYIVVSARNLAQATKIQLEIGNDPTTWEAYTPIEQYTASLGRTIYGGQADIVTGEGEDENGNAFTFTPITPIPETALGTNNFWADEGDSDVTYRSSGTVTPVPVVPTLITKSITENGTYSAEDDDADGYSEVTVNVAGGQTPFVPQFSETLIADNTAHASSFTLSEDYGNYDMVKIVWYESATSSGFLYTTPDILDEIFSVGVGKICINKPSTNYYVCYTKAGLTWTQTNQRNIYVHEIYGVTFTNCTMTATDLYKRGASTITKYAITSQESLKDYDLFVMSSIHNSDGSETMPTTWLYQYPPENMSGAFSCPVPTVLQEYNANDEAFVISEYEMTAARYFMVQGIKFTPTPSLLSMGGLTSSNEEPTEPENNEEEEEE